MPFTPHGTGTWILVFKLATKLIVPALVGYGGLWGRRRMQRSRQNSASGWHSVDGTVVWAKSGKVGDTPRHSVTLTYSYLVDEYRSGEYTQEFGREEDADEFARNIRDRRIQIRYKPTKPDVSVIEQSTLEQLSPVGLRRG